jgi:DNA repair exonuclease SbcCD ATPase subunit
MFSIEKIILENFKSFKGSHTFIFPTESGLYFIQGRNDAEPSLGGNGTGKSTVLDAIVWCLYGQTTRGLRAGEIITRGEGSASVEAHLTVNNEIIVVRRSQNPNSLTLGSRTVVQGDLLKALRLSQQAFTFSVIFPQKGDWFFELKPSEKLTLFSQIMNLEFWLEQSQGAADEANRLEGKLNNIKSEVEKIGATRAATLTLINECKAKASMFASETAVTISKLQASMSALDAVLADKDKRLKNLDELIGYWTENIKEREASLQRQSGAHASHAAKVRQYENEIAIIKQAHSQAEQAAHKLSSLGATCPTCNQTITGAHLKAEKTKAAKKVALFEADLRLARQNLKESEGFADKVAVDVTEQTQLIRRINDDIRAWEITANRLEAELKAGRKERNALVCTIDAEINRKNPYHEMIREKKKLLADLNQQLDQQETLLEEVTAQHAAVKYWIQGFKKLRLFLVEETLLALEIEVNNTLTSLGLIDWSVEFAVERENASGGITKGFIVLIRNAEWSDPIRLEAYSGGEASRLLLAGNLGLANLIMTQAGLKNTIEMWDEPSNYLSQSGLRDLAETLHQRALDEGKIIILIDHHTIDFGEFTKTYLVVKDENGSRINAE